MRIRQSGLLVRRWPVVAAAAAVLLAGGVVAAAPWGNDSAAATASDAGYLASGQEIASLFRKWDEALATGDPNRIANLYTPDAVLLPTLSNRVRTDRAGIVDYFTHFMEKHPRGVILESHIKVLDADSAIDSGRYRFTFDDGTTTAARYTFEYEKRSGHWLITNHHSSRMPEG